MNKYMFGAGPGGGEADGGQAGQAGNPPHAAHPYEQVKLFKCLGFKV